MMPMAWLCTDWHTVTVSVWQVAVATAQDVPEVTLLTFSVR